MLTDDIDTSVLSRGVRLLLPWLGSNLPELPGTLWRLASSTFRTRAHGGIYEVLAYESTLELLDPQGKQAHFQKQQQVRFLQDNVVAILDQAWGEGQILEDYKCSPGVKVDEYREGHRWRILISLRQSKRRGDIEMFSFDRTIKDGFTEEVEYFQTQIDNTFKKVTSTIIFPRQRPPKRAFLIEKIATKSTQLGPQHIATRPDGRQQVRWSLEKPRLFETYTLQWEW